MFFYIRNSKEKLEKLQQKSFPKDLNFKHWILFRLVETTGKPHIQDCKSWDIVFTHPENSLAEINTLLEKKHRRETKPLQIGTGVHKSK